TAGEGSTFTLLLPATLAPSAPAAKPPAEPAAEGNGASGAVAAALADELDFEPKGAPQPEVADDRERLAPGDRVVLIVSDTLEEGDLALSLARERGLKAIVALGGAGSLTLAQEHPIDGALLLGGTGLLVQLKHHPRTRHVPVWVVGDRASRHAALQAGAAGFVERPLEREALEAAFAGLEETLDRPTKRLLHVADDANLRTS